jgi:cysteine desulfurase
MAVSTGAACSSGTLEPSHVLRAMGFAPSRVQSALRFSLGRGNDETQVDALVNMIPALVQRLRKSARPAVRR